GLPPPLRRAPEPRGHGSGVPGLERTLERAQRLFEGAECRKQFVPVHEEDLGPERRLRSGEPRGVACPWAESRAGRRGKSKAVGQEGRYRLRQMARERE